MKAILVVAVLSLWSVPGDQPDRPALLKTLRSQADEMARTMLEEKFQRAAELMLPALVRELGGPEKTVKTLEDAFAGMKAKGMKIVAAKADAPSGLAKNGADWYGVVPYSLEVTVPNARVTLKPYLVAISQDGGKNWKFMDSAGIVKDKSKLKVFLPNFPADLKLPEVAPPKVEKTN